MKFNRLPRFSLSPWLPVGLLVALAISFILYIQSERQSDRAYDRRHQSFLLADELRQSLDDRTRMARTYVVTGDPIYRKRYQDILKIREGQSSWLKSGQNNHWNWNWGGVNTPLPRTDSAQQAIALPVLMQQAGFTDDEFRLLAEANVRIDTLITTEREAMQLAEATGPEAEARRTHARLMLYDDHYHQAKATIMKSISALYGLIDQHTRDAIHIAETRATIYQFTVIVLGLGLVVALWRIYIILRDTLGGSVDTVYAQITQIGTENLSPAIAMKAGQDNTVLGWLSELRTQLNTMDRERQRAKAALQESEARVRMKLDSILSPDGDLNTLELADIMDISAMQTLMEQLSALTQITVGILDLKGQVLVATGWQDICVQFHRSHPQTCQNCLESDTQLSHGVAPGAFKRYRCKNGMYDVATPITVGGRHLGNLFLGQFFFEDEPPDREFFRSQARRYGFDEQVYLAALDRTPRWSRDRIQVAMTFCAQFAHLISSLSYSNIQLARSVAERESLLAALQESEARFRRAVEEMPVPIMIHDEEGHVLQLSIGWTRYSGYTVEDLPTLNDWAERAYGARTGLTQDSATPPLATWEAIQNGERTITAKDDSQHVWEFQTTPLGQTRQGRRILLSLAVDITERKRIEEAQMFLSQCGYLKPDEDFFTSLASYLAQSLNMDYVCIHRLLDDGLSAQTVAIYCNGKFKDNLVHTLKETLCGNVLGKTVCCVPNGVRHLFPHDPVLQKMKAESYVGTTLWGFQRQPVGLITVIGRIPLANPHLAESLLTLVAVRAAGELERQRAETELRIAAIAFEAQEGMIVADARSNILRVNRAFTEITGYTAEEAVGQTPRLLQSGRHDAAFYAAMWECIHRDGAWQGEVWNRHKTGAVYPEWLAITAVKGNDGVVTHYVSTLTDITQRKAAEDEIKHLAFYDPLTRLPNRRLLLDRLHQALVANARSQHQGALIFIDLDHFKTLNDTHGHDKGDLLLQQVAQRLTLCVRAGDTVARLGGDEFVVMLENLSMQPQDAAAQAKMVGEKILGALNQPYQLADHEHHSTPSLGVTLFSDDRETVEDLLKRADLAMYQAKAAGRNALRFFDPEMQAAVAARAVLEAELREGVQNGQFILYYQPQVDSAGHLIGAEALLRWQHPRLGLVSSAEFIPLAEETGLILPLGYWVLETACAQLVEWSRQPETALLTLAVNVSTRQFRQPNFVDRVLAMLDQQGVDPGKLKLELTESLLLNNVEDTIAKMITLKAQGVGFSLDDFGTGYSSLAYLKRLPLDQLKIDRSFVCDVLTDPNDAAIAKTIVTLAHSLGLAVIAEGVETEGQRDFLTRSGCHAFQGYLFGRPELVEALDHLEKIHPASDVAQTAV